MTVFNIIVGSLKVLMILGFVEYVAPGLSYDASKYIVGMMFQ